MSPTELKKELYKEWKNLYEYNSFITSNKSFLLLLKATREMYPNDQEFGREVSKLLDAHVIKDR